MEDVRGPSLGLLVRRSQAEKGAAWAHILGVSALLKSNSKQKCYLEVFPHPSSFFLLEVFRLSNNWSFPILGELSIFISSFKDMAKHTVLDLLIYFLK